LKFRSNKLRVYLLTIFLAIGTTADAGVGNSMQDELRIFTEEIATQCTSVKEQLENFNIPADPLTGYNLKDAVQSLCVCLPEKTQAFRSTLSPEDLARPISEEEFLGRFHPAVIDKCAAEQLHTMYGEQCRKRFRKAGLNTSQYCSCMKDVVGGFSEATAAAIAAAASDYLPLAAEAEKKGEPAPSRPPILESYYQADLGCKARKP